eukprot:1157625-Pelagomonas_calceolata.AAC.5
MARCIRAHHKIANGPDGVTDGVTGCIIARCICAHHKIASGPDGVTGCIMARCIRAHHKIANGPDGVTGCIIARWPRWRDIRDRPHFLEQYPCRDGQVYNVNSFLGKLDPHGGKYYVPPRQYAKFLEVGCTHQTPPVCMRALQRAALALSGQDVSVNCLCYSCPIRASCSRPLASKMEQNIGCCMTKDPDAVVEDVLPEVIDSIVRTAQEFYQAPTWPFHMVSMFAADKMLRLRGYASFVLLCAAGAHTAPLRGQHVHS